MLDMPFCFKLEEPNPSGLFMLRSGVDLLPCVCDYVRKFRISNSILYHTRRNYSPLHSRLAASFKSKDYLVVFNEHEFFPKTLSLLISILLLAPLPS